MMTSRVQPALAANVVWIGNVDSTNDLAARLVASWAEDEDDRLGDTLFVAGCQTAGRGRSGHSWVSPAGGCYATWLGWITSSELGWLPLAAGVCLAAAVEAALPGIAVGLKWPNDLLVAGRKLGGVLCQSRSRGASAWAAVGVGVTVGSTPVTPSGTSFPATSLRELGLVGDADASIWAVAGGFARRLRPALADPAALVTGWLARAVHRHGDPLRVRKGDEVLIGTYAGMGDDGQLAVEVAGTIRRIAAGELIDALPGAGAEG
jgi:BirA family biotin operon repressor/biotin-[acetyl-CoA-carboxylase] ligase